MLLIAVCGVAVLAVVCWAALRESVPAAETFIPQTASGDHDDRPRDGGGPSEDTGRQADAQEPAGGGAEPRSLGDATVDDADTDEALAAAAALWGVLDHTAE